MDQLLAEIGDRIRQRRKQLGLTQEDLSNRADVTTQTISNAELGLKGMRPDTIIRICAALEISTDYLLLGKINDTDKSLFWLYNKCWGDPNRAQGKNKKEEHIW